MLNVNMAFLAIGTVDASTPSYGVDHSAMKILSYISGLLNLGAILVGLILLRQTRISRKNTANEAGEFIRNNTYVYFGFEPLVIMYRCVAPTAVEKIANNSKAFRMHSLCGGMSTSSNARSIVNHLHSPTECFRFLRHSPVCVYLEHGVFLGP